MLVAYGNFSRFLALVFPSVFAEAEGFEPPRPFTDLIVFKTILFTSLSILPSDAPLLNAEIWGKSYGEGKNQSSHHGEKPSQVICTSLTFSLRPTSGAGIEGIEPTPNG